MESTCQYLQTIEVRWRAGASHYVTWLCTWTSAMIAFGSWQNSLNSLPSGKMSCKILGPNAHFTGNALLSIPRQVNAIRIEAKYFMPRQFRTCYRMILSSSQSKASCKKSLASLSQTFTNVLPSSLCTGNLALSVPVIPASNSVAIASQKHCVISTCRILGVWHSFIQWWNVALITAIVSAGHSVSITPEKHSMTHACRNLGVCVKLLSELPPNEQRTWTGTKQVSALTQSTGHKNPEHSTRDPPVINPKQKGENNATQKKRTYRTSKQVPGPT